jgi:hypothetical protein
MIERRRPVASVPGLVAQPLSTVPSSDGYDE